MIRLNESGAEVPLTTVDNSKESNLLRFKGRLFRKQALRTKLINPPPTNDDKSLFTSALHQWGASISQFVEGAFIAIFSMQDKIYLCRGVYDSPALYYSTIDNNGSNELLLCDKLDILIERLPKPIELDTQAIRHFLAFSLNKGDSTPFAGIHAVAAGQCMRISKNNEITSSPTHIPLTDLEPITDRTQAVEVWRQSMTEALIEMADGRDSIALFLSGGIDSGTIAVIAKQIGLPLHTVTMGLANFENENESHYGRGLSGYLGLEHYPISVRADCFDGIQDTKMCLQRPGVNPYQLFLEAGYQQVSEIGASTLWTGSWGDEILSPIRNILRDTYRFASLSEAFSIASSSREVPHLYKTFLNHLLSRRSRPMCFPKYMIDRDREVFQYSHLIGGSVVDRFHRSYLFKFDSLNSHEMELVELADKPFQRVHPYVHPATFEAGLRIPAHIAHSPQFRKWVMREALVGLAPKEFVWRSRVGVLNEYYNHGWQKNQHIIKSTVFNGNESWSQFVDYQTVERAFDVGPNGEHAMLLLNCLSLELWLEQLRSMGWSFTFR